MEMGHHRRMLVESRPSFDLTKLDAFIQQQKSEKPILDTSTKSQSQTDSHVDDWVDMSSVDSVTRQTFSSISFPGNDASLVQTTQKTLLPNPVGREKHALVGTQFTRFLQEYAEPIAISCQKTLLYKSYFATLCYSHGPTHMKRWTEKGEELFGVMSGWSAYGMRVAIRLPIICSRTLSLAVYAQRESKRQQSLSVRFFMSFPSIVPLNAPIIRASKAGDVESIKAMFEAKTAAYTDTTPTGTCLLHVRLPKSSASENTLIKPRLLHGKDTQG